MPPATMLRMQGRNLRDAVDHLLLGARDLDEGIVWLERKTGVRAAIGGVHPGRGTRNALASLGRGQYLEVIAPDPAQTAFEFHIDIGLLAEPRLVTWAASADDVDSVAAAARTAGLAVAGPRDGSRRTPEGSTLRWRSVAVDAGLRSGSVEPVPFFIEWTAGARHPSLDAPAGLRLIGVAIRHRHPDRLRSALEACGIEAAVAAGEEAALSAELDTPKGRVVL